MPQLKRMVHALLDADVDLTDDDAATRVLMETGLSPVEVADLGDAALEIARTIRPDGVDRFVDVAEGFLHG